MKSQSASTKPGPAVVPIDQETFLAKFGEKDRASLERQRLAYETKLGAGTADRWLRLARVLLTLAPLPPRLGAAQTMQFYIPDGKYRKQVFALHARADGELAIYCPNVLTEALRAGILRKRGGTEPLYAIGSSAETLTIDSLDGNTPNLEPFYKDMTGWNRKAIRILLPPSASKEQMTAAEQVCALAGGTWK